MSILSTLVREKLYKKKEDGYHPLSRWTSSDTIEMPSGKTLSEHEVWLTAEAYEALSEEEKAADVHYYVESGGSSDNGDVLYVGTVIDNLLSSETNLPLSANQGRVLNEKIDEVNDGLESVNESLNGLSFVPTTETAYEEMESHDANTLYIFVEETEE